MSTCVKCGQVLDTEYRCHACGCDNLPPSFENAKPTLLPAGIQPRNSTEFPIADPSVDRIVALCECNGRLYLATERHIYRQEGDRWIPMKMERPDDGHAEDANWWKDKA